MDLNHISVFARVVETGSFSAAARALGTPKATISRNVAQLEATLGARLLNRTTRRVELTELGRAFYEEASSGLAAFATARQRIDAAQAVPSGTLRIAAPVAFGTRNLMGWIAEFLEKYEQVRIELRLTDDPIDPVTHRVDIAFWTRRPANSSLIIRTIGTTRLILVASPAYLERRGIPARIQDLQHHDCIAFGPSLDAERWRLKGPRGWIEINVSGRIAVEGSHAEIQSALAGLGIALLPMAPIADHLRNGELQQVLPDYGIDGGTLRVVHASNRHMPAAQRAFLDFVARKAEK
ncbi:LysR family transcriptional regulator [Paracoccus alkanivorans]|uniref:LysR family transcriptional regulator n=1 Tax=Paracoccus alkanivorans TaxID=2116655 RepID=A0A3M0M3Z0_9RHOB|nr:LysR family transcriptional regulator [Paracoccus alkanivorans]RMC32478.1 LysR family transcriptional regulator [Paracoccus alkanivorans]